jgi:Tetratricopeptide repeat
MKLLAIRYDRQGSDRREAGDAAGAIRLFKKAIQHAPKWSVPWYNLGLTYKYAGNWVQSYRCNAMAVQLNPKDEAAIWNMGIAATALQDWAEARRAWKLYGIEVPMGDGPIEMDLGSVPIRLNPDGDGEVVWAHRVDPARAVLASIPLPESNHRYGDLVLNDGAPVGYRIHDGQEVPVFNELKLLTSSGFGTYEVTLQARNIDDLVSFEHVCERYHCPTEDWSTIRMICRQCSEGRPHEHPEPAIEGPHRFAVAASALSWVEELVAAWIAEDPSRTAGEVLVRLQPSKL